MGGPDLGGLVVGNVDNRSGDARRFGDIFDADVDATERRLLEPVELADVGVGFALLAGSRQERVDPRLEAARMGLLTRAALTGIEGRSEHLRIDASALLQRCYMSCRSGCELGGTGEARVDQSIGDR